MPTALITGAGVRVGRAIALALLDAGFDLLLHANRSLDGVREVARTAQERGRRAEVLRHDLSREDGPLELARAGLALAPSLDLLVNNAGLYERLPFGQVSPQAYRRMLGVNLEAPFFLTQALLPALEAASGCVVNITDSAVERPYAQHSAYFVSKAGLEMLTRVLALELAPKVRVNGVAPGVVAFPEGFPEVMRRSIVSRVPLQREGTPEDVARAVVFLAVSAPYVTGHVLGVDGGLAVG